ncbi:hypothetical protein BB559_005110, partial [Furculomyces boomerangus]
MDQPMFIALTNEQFQELVNNNNHQPNVQRAPPLHNLIRLPNFSGSSREDVETWIMSIENWMNATGITEDNQVIAIAISYLQKEALA